MREKIPGLLAGLLLVLSGGIAHANEIKTFSVSGELEATPSGVTGTFSGTLTIDVTDGNALAVDIDVDGIAAIVNSDFYNIVFQSDTITDPVTLILTNGTSSLLGFSMMFTTTTTPGSLVGFTGGSIVGGFIAPVTLGPTITFGPQVANNVTGAISIPEPATLALLGIGFAGLAASRRHMLT